LGQLQELVQYVESVDTGRQGEAVARSAAEARARAEKARATELARQLGLIQARSAVLEQEKRQASSRSAQLEQQVQALQAALSEREAEGSAAMLERDALKARLADLSGQRQLLERQFHDTLGSQQRQIQASVARHAQEREEFTRRLDQLRRELSEALRELHETRLVRDRLLTENQREGQAREQLAQQVEDLEQKLHQAQAERSKASHLARMSHAEAFEARDQAELLERKLRTLEQLVGAEASGVGNA
jgi:chromosome segregation ATPase